MSSTIACSRMTTSIARRLLLHEREVLGVVEHVHRRNERRERRTVRAGLRVVDVAAKDNRADLDPGGVAQQAESASVCSPVRAAHLQVHLVQHVGVVSLAHPQRLWRLVALRRHARRVHPPLDRLVDVVLSPVLLVGQDAADEVALREGHRAELAIERGLDLAARVQNRLLGELRKSDAAVSASFPIVVCHVCKACHGRKRAAPCPSVQRTTKTRSTCDALSKRNLRPPASANHDVVLLRPRHAALVLEPHHLQLAAHHHHRLADGDAERARRRPRRRRLALDFTRKAFDLLELLAPAPTCA